MTTQDFGKMLADAKKGAGLITAGLVTLQCISAQHGVSKNGGDPQIIGSYKLIGGQFNGRTMKAWHTLKSDTPASVMGFFETMAAHGIPEQDIIAMGQPNDQAMAALAARMVNKIVDADVYHQDDNRNPGKKSAWLQAFRAHTGPMPQVGGNGAAPAPAPTPAPAPAPAPNGTPNYMGQGAVYNGQQQAPAPAYAPQPQVQAPVYQPQQPAPQPPVYGQPQAPAPAAHSGMPPQHSGQYQQAPAPAGYQQAPQAPAPQPPAPQAPAPAADQQVAPVPGQQPYTEEPPF